MTRTDTDRLTDPIVRATQRLAQIHARRLLRDMRAASTSKIRARRLDRKRQVELGGAVIAAGCGDWPASEIVGLVLDGRDRFGGSVTMRLGLRKRGDEYLHNDKRREEPANTPASGI